MITNRDIQKITAVVATKADLEEFRGIKDEVFSTKEVVQGLVPAVDRLTKKVDDLRI